MKKAISLILLLLLIVSCNNDKLEFSYKEYEKTSSLNCGDSCPKVTIRIPVAKNVPIVSDSINKKIFNVLKEIIYFGEDPYVATDYDQLLDSFIDSYEDIKTKFPNDALGWEAKVDGKIKYESDSIINVEISHYSYTGGAHGYSGLRSLIFNKKTGKIIPNKQLFSDLKGFNAFAEKKFKTENKIPETDSINATGLLFENDVFELPSNIFYTEKGLLLYFNTYEIASYADGPRELLLSYNEIKPFLKIR